MRRLFFIPLFAAALWAAGCSEPGEELYPGEVHTLTVQAVYPEGYAEMVREGVTVTAEDIDRGNSYKAPTDAGGTARLQLTNGLYRVMAKDRNGKDIFNGTADMVRVVGRDAEIGLPLVHSRAGSIVIKEIYCGGCMKYPQEGKYQSDKYIILHNNDSEEQYLDSLCFATFDPYNSQGTNVWVTQDPETGASVYPDFVPAVQAIWQFGGNGRSFPLAPGEDAVLVVCGAIDHAAQYPLSVNLNREGYFVCYNNVYFWNTLYHPAPGDRIAPDHYLDVVIKVGQANAFTFSVFSPAAAIFRAQGVTVQEFVAGAENVIQKPGSTVDRIVKIPLEWVLDGVEVFYGGSSNNKKRIPPSIDAGYVTQSALYTGRTLHRRTDEEATREAGYEILMDTNNSSTDFYERERQSLHD